MHGNPHSLPSGHHTTRHHPAWREGALRLCTIPCLEKGHRAQNFVQVASNSKVPHITSPNHHFPHHTPTWKAFLSPGKPCFGSLGAHETSQRSRQDQNLADRQTDSFIIKCQNPAPGLCAPQVCGRDRIEASIDVRLCGRRAGGVRGGALCPPSRHGEPSIAAARNLMPSRAIPTVGATPPARC